MGDMIFALMSPINPHHRDIVPVTVMLSYARKRGFSQSTTMVNTTNRQRCVPCASIGLQPVRGFHLRGLLKNQISFEGMASPLRRKRPTISADTYAPLPNVLALFEVVYIESFFGLWFGLTVMNSLLG